MSSVVLPPEVVEHVIDCCLDNSYTLRQLTLTCRQLLPRSRYHLFASIRIEGADLEALYLFYDTLAAHPWLRLLIRSVKIVARANLVLDTELDTEEKPNLLDIIPATLLTLPRLTQWSIVRDSTLILPTAKPASFTPRVLASYGKYGSTIRVLCLQDIEYLTGDDFWRFLSAFPSLRSLCRQGITFEQPGVLRTLTQPGYRRPRKLELDSLEIAGPLADDAITVLLESCSRLASLESLLLDVSQAERFVTFISQLPRLCHLTLEIKLGGEDTVRSIARIAQVLNLFAESPISSRNAFEFILQMSISSPSRLNHQLAVGDTPRLCQALEQQLLGIPPLQRVIFRFRGLRAHREHFWIVELGHHFPKLRQRGLVGVCTDQVTAIGHDNVRPRYDNFVSSYDNVMSAVAVSQDNEWMASGSTDTTIILWSLKQRRIVHEWVAHRGEVTCLAFSPDGQSLVSGGRDSAIVIWDISRPQGAQRILTLEDRHGSPPEACAWSRAHCEDAGSLVACAFPKERKIHVWDAHTLQHRYTLAFHGFACAKDFFTFSPDGRWLAAEGVRGSCFVWETATGALHTVLRDPGLDIRTAVFDPSSKRIATTSGRGGNAMVQIWGVEAGVRLLSFGKGPLGAMGSLNVSFSPNGRTVLSAAGDRLTIWDAATGEVIRALHESVDIVIRLCFSPDGKYVTSTSFDGAVTLWRVRDGACVATLSACPRVAHYVGFSATAETVFYACDDGSVYMHRLHDIVKRSIATY